VRNPWVDSPWADPETPTEPGAPYAGPPPTAPYAGYPVPSRYGPPVYGYPGYGYPGYGYPGYGHPGYGYPSFGQPVAPRPPRRPGQLVTAAVLTFVQAALVLVTSLYVYFFAALLEIASRDVPLPGAATAFAGEGTVLAIVQVISAVLLVVGGIRVLMRRTPAAWWLLVGALAAQVVLAAYWLVRLVEFERDLPGPDEPGPFLATTFVYAAMPLVALGMVLFGPGKRWFERPGTDAAAGPGTATVQP
jgi:hypothetical protein